VANRLPLLFVELFLDLNLVHIVLEVSSDDQVSLISQMYDAVRRFESCFKSVCCTQSDLSCHRCVEQSERCPYRSVFGQTLSHDPYVVRRHQKPPLPFTFKISKIERASSCIEISIVIAGNAIQYVSIFLDAFNLLVASVGENNGVDIAVSGSWCLDYQGGRHELNAPSLSLVLLSGLEILQSTLYSDAIRIYLESPLRLLCSGSIAHSFDFTLMFRSQLRRCSSLFAYYGEGELELDYGFLSEAAERVTCLRNNSGFTKPQWTNRVALSGMLGVVEFTDLADGMLPLLMLGSYFNAGKGAAYGMGVYRIEELSTTITQSHTPATVSQFR